MMSLEKKTAVSLTYHNFHKAMAEIIQYFLHSITFLCSNSSATIPPYGLYHL